MLWHKWGYNFQMSDRVSWEANKQEGPPGYQEVGFFLLLEQMQEWDREKHVIDCVDRFTWKKDREEVNTETEREVSWKKQNCDSNTGTGKQLEALILLSRRWFQGFVLEPLKVCHKPWDWKDDGKHYPYLSCPLCSRGMSHGLEWLGRRFLFMQSSVQADFTKVTS